MCYGSIHDRVSTQLFGALLTVIIMAGCAVDDTQSPTLTEQKPPTRVDAEKLLVVDCLLPGRIQKMGQRFVYSMPSRPIKTTAVDCEIRGGEYTAHDRADYRTALNIWLPQAQSGDSAAQNYVGEIYEKGLGVQPNYELALLWYRKAAVQGYKRAQINVGYMYEKGLGIEKNMFEALKWYRKSSGLEETELVVTTSVQIASATANEEQIQSLLQELSRHKDEVERLRERLENTKQRLDSQKHNLHESEQALIELRKRLTKYDQEGDSVDGNVDIKLIQSQLQEQEGLVTMLTGKIDGLHSELAQQKEQLDSKLKTTDIAAFQDYVPPGPSIELIEPPIALTRGRLTAKIPRSVRKKLIVGKVIAPMELSRLTVNNREIKPDPYGTFRTTVMINNSSIPVSIVAEDAKSRKASFEFVFLSDEPPIVASSNDAVPKDRSKAPQLGRYYALIIGNDKYPFFSDLISAKNDAQYLERLLRKKYNFQTHLLINAKRVDVLDELNKLRDRLTKKDSLLVYYAGHGEQIPGHADTKRPELKGYWLPIDAEPDKTTNWISNRAITEILETMLNQHVLVIADACYSGTMTRTSIPRLDTDVSEVKRAKWMQLMSAIRSRKVLTSGGIKPVLDKGGGKHSIFAKTLFNVLEQNDGILTLSDVYWEIRDRVQALAADYKVEQIPQYGPIKYAGHEGGEFFFVPVAM